MVLRKKKAEQLKRPGLVGVTIRPEGIALAHVTRKAGLRLEAYQFRACKDPHEAPAVLKAAVQELDLASTATVYVLDHNTYEMFLVEEPKVKAEELALAMRWRIKDYLEYPLEEAIIDFIQVPPDGRADKMNMAYVLGAKKEFVDRQSEMVLQAGLDLQVVDGIEFAIRNIAQELFKEGPRAILHLDKARSQLLMMGGLKLYMMRYLEVDLTPLYSPDLGDDDLKRRLYAELGQEIQRSLDYCVGNLYQHRPIELLCAPLEYDTPELVESLSEGLGIPVRYFDFTTFMTCKTPPGQAQQYRCLAAIGGALRQDTLAYETTY